MNIKKNFADNVQQTAINEMANNTPLRVIKLKAESNDKVFNALNSAIKAGATTLIATPRVDVAGCGYVWFGIRKEQTELDGKLLLNEQIANYIKAFLMGEELPTVTNCNPDSEACCQEEWLAIVEAEVAKLADSALEEYNESDEGVGYLTKKYTFANGKVIMPAQQVADVAELFA
jgi:hypothetical protein